MADRLEVGIARLEGEAEQQVLNHELSHRLKNTFAMIQAIASQTLRTIPDQVPVKTFIDRLHALSQAHDVLLQKNWSSADIRSTIYAVLHSLGEGNRFQISGAYVEVGSAATLSLLLHELMTNAMKYGALSCESGHVSIKWRINNTANDAQFVLMWNEIGGPPAAPPSKQGFGSKLIRMGLMGNGGVGLRYLPTGLEAELTAPLAHMKRS